MGGQIHFKTDNQPLFEFSVEELPAFGFELSEVTRNLHENGPVGVMTDYEAKFHDLGQPINRLVGTMADWTEPFPDKIKAVRNRWLDVFADGVPEEELGKWVLSDLGEGNYLWHLFGLVPCLQGDAARTALAEHLDDEIYLFYNEHPPADVPQVQRVTKEDIAALPRGQGAIDGADWYLVDRDFTWTYAQTHEDDRGPYFYQPEQKDRPAE